MKVYKLKQFTSILTLLIIVFTMTGCGIKTEKEESLAEKVDEEMEYVSIQLLDMLNILNSINVKNYSVITQKSNQTSSSSQEKQKGTSEENEKSGSDEDGQTRKWKW